LDLSSIAFWGSVGSGGLVMISASRELKPKDIETMDRSELIGRLGKLKECIGSRFTRQWMNRLSTPQLQIMLLAAQLYRVLQNRDGRGESPNARVWRGRRTSAAGIN
jgi:hypothetical protein